MSDRMVRTKALSPRPLPTHVLERAKGGPWALQLVDISVTELTLANDLPFIALLYPSFQLALIPCFRSMMETPRPLSQITTRTSSVTSNIKAFSWGGDAQPTGTFFLNRKDLAGPGWQEPSWGKRVDKALDSSNAMLRTARFGLP
jgi:hypothetical protein